ncbi:MAG: hypothetical protein J6Q75_03270 [Bacteroidaceae bacterium]|nr:hypothetical protein [Bacteroidaceae bacterium]
MKKLLFILTGVALLTACQKISLEDFNAPTTESEVRILTRSASNVNISYPIYLYAFNISSGKLQSSSTLKSESDTPVLNLGAGTYHLVAVAGIEDCEVPEQPTINSTITLPKDSLLQQPLQMGSADISVSKSTTVTITLYNQVTAINIALTDIPDDVSACHVSFSLMHNSISYGGKLSGTTVNTIELNKQGNNIWSAPLFYTLPSSNQQLTLSINCTSPQVSNTYGYIHNGQLAANTPYNIMGSYKTGFAVNGVINLAGWNAPQEINFTFGAENNENSDDSNDDENDDTEEDRDEYVVNSIPKVGTIWNNHFVATVLDATTSEAELILLSTTEWDGVTSATHAETPHMAANFAASYTEDGMTNWSIPSRDEAKLMRTAIGLDKLEYINAVLKANNIPQLNVGESDKGESIRYLCDDATFTYVWDGTSISKSGTKRTYNLRLIKRVKVVTK